MEPTTTQTRSRPSAKKKRLDHEMPPTSTFASTSGLTLLACISTSTSFVLVAFFSDMVGLHVDALGARKHGVAGDAERPFSEVQICACCAARQHPERSIHAHVAFRGDVQTEIAEIFDTTGHAGWH
eukprot:741031-Prymnesium_polylepis.1